MHVEVVLSLRITSRPHLTSPHDGGYVSFLRRRAVLTVTRVLRAMLFAGTRMCVTHSFPIPPGETYFVPAGHLPVIEEKTVMIEFSQDTTYTNKDFIEKK